MVKSLETPHWRTIAIRFYLFPSKILKYSTVISDTMEVFSPQIAATCLSSAC